MSLKSALFEMKEVLTNQKNDKFLEEDFISELEKKYGLSENTLVFYYNNLMFLSMKSSSDHLSEAKKVNRKWTKNEIDFMFQYIKERQEESINNITELLKEVALLLNRGYQSVNYKYYSLVKEKEENQKENHNGYHFTTLTEKEVPVISTEVLPESHSVFSNQTTQPSSSMNLLDILSGLITNVEQIPGIQLNELLGSLYQLTNMALQNRDAAQQLKKMKAENQREKEALKEQLKQKEQQLLLEKKRNDELQQEIVKLAKEISAFNQLGDAAKIQNLKSYNQRLNYLIDGSGVVLKVGTDKATGS
ncbi:hypothetical protein P4482_06185 [Neobacillus thermocopriae]|uniref:hypothetical protein n=1 Tax=Neobacillus thermocopriae TaxID=1215031 RepID=UPI002E249E3C|nr:hypothetical protein [Neobacillus thermocopriae]MED3713803.1 hypothetical protein [Neobacillus thermocopriae]